MQLSVGSDRPDLRSDVVLLLQDFRGVQNLLHDAPGAEQPHSVLGPRRRLTILVHALDNVLIDVGPLRLLGHHQVLVVDHDIVDHILVLAPHLIHSVLNDRAHLPGESGIPSSYCRAGSGGQQGMAVLVLQALAVQGGPPRGRAHQEAPAPSVRSLPDQVCHPLPSEHGVVYEEREGGGVLAGVGGPSSNPSRHSTGLTDPLLQQLAVRGLGVLEHLCVILRHVVLAGGGVDLELLEETLETESTSLISDNGDDALAELPGLHHAPQQLTPGHGRGHGACRALVQEPIHLITRQIRHNV
mmetsp:Transcript_48252/g.104994  ORF Transcript_48252/g.104994 Transcript_48252/m.104994 type:complete len:299 (-) Transcript_48252:1673-2569(-)